MHPAKREACISLVCCCVSGLTTAPRMLTPIAGFCRLVEPLPRTSRLLTPLVSSPGTAESAPDCPISCRPARALRHVLRFSPEDLGPPFPPPWLEGNGRKAQGA